MDGKLSQEDMDRQEVEAILNFAIDFAEQCLDRYNGFDPFGGVVNLDGELQPYAVSPEDAENPQELRELVEGLASAAGGSRAVFYCTDGMAQTSDDGPAMDAIILHIEHWHWGASKLSMTYERKSNGYEYGELRRTLAEPVFPDVGAESN